MVLVRHGNLNTVSYCHPVIGQAFIRRGIAGYPRTLGLWHCLLLLSIHLGVHGYLRGDPLEQLKVYS